MDTENIKLLGAIAGTITGTAALAWRIIDEFGSFLRISLKVEAPKDGWTTALTTVENKGYRPKKISYALLLVGPEGEQPIQTARTLAKKAGFSGQLDHTNDLEHFRVSATVDAQNRYLIPLPYYYSENVDIADETLCYRVPIPVASFEPGKPFAVRLFVFANGRLHRSTQDAFITETSKLSPADEAPRIE